MNTQELKAEEKYLNAALDCIDTEMKDLDSRLTGGIEAANEQAIEAITQQFLRRLKILILIKDKPYFARVDFKAENAAAERLYIGKSTLTDENDKTVVIDWRAPVSTLYYEGRVGEASYDCPDGTINGEILLKRQFEIENRKLLSYNDIDITFDEELLKPYLSVSSNTRLKNIIATIQSEQNRIIRAKLTKPLIVQGVAGSGKTTVALHRIAYLIYATNIKPEQFLIIAPNAIFLDYISDILPDLGVENVNQKTFDSLAQDIIGKKLKIEEPGEKLSRIIDGENMDEEIAASQFKSSLLFRDMIDRYLKDIEKALLPHDDFCAGRHILCSYKEIYGMFANEYGGAPFSRRIDMIKERFKNLIADNANLMIAGIDKNRRRKISLLPKELSAEEYKKRKQEIYGEDEEVVHDLLTGGKAALKTYFKKIKLPTATECYSALLSSPETFRKYSEGLSQDIISFICGHSQKAGKGIIEYEDLAPLLYLHNRIHGTKEGVSIKHVIIDEAQDLSEFQFYVIKEVLGCGSMTILGDVAQGIYYYRGTSSWGNVSDKVFGGNCNLAVLQKSYRSTVEIMEQANKVISRLGGFEESEKAVPVIRNGDPVRYVVKSSEKEIVADVALRISELQSKGLKNISVICKTMKGCSDFAKQLKKYISEFNIISGKEYEGGLSIVPSYFVKGLEFDAAIIADAHLYRDNEIEIKLLYVAMTRAMHCMDVYSIGSQPEFLK